MNNLPSSITAKASFSCRTKDLRGVLNFIKSVQKKTWMKERPYCEITIKTDEVEFVVDGAKKTLYCKAEGPARVIISFAYLLHLVNDRPKVATKVIVDNDEMTINETTVFVDTWFFEDDSILRSIGLPVNYGLSDLIRVSKKYTSQEIEFNKLSEQCRKATNSLSNDIRFISGKLKKYNISKDEVEAFIHSKIFHQTKTQVK